MKARINRFISNVIEILKRPDMCILPGQLAFFFILSLVPILTLLSFLGSFFNISISDINSYFNIHIGNEILEIIKPSIGYSELKLQLIILILVSLYLSSNGTNSIIIAADNIYNIKQKSYLYRRIKAIIMVFIMIILFLFILLVPIFGTFILKLLIGNSLVYKFMNIIKIPFSFIVIYILIKIIYTIAPDKQIPSKFVTKGALFTSTLWIISTCIYTAYATHIAHYKVYYSGLSNVIILMIWIYILSYIFVIGICINYMEEPYELEKTKNYIK